MKLTNISLLLFILTLISIGLALTFGAANISSTQLVQCLFSQCNSALNETILWQIRLPRVLVGFAAGAGLACAGAILQNTTRNPLADPYLFGIVSGAGLGATIASIGFNDQLNIALPLAAFLGALFSISIVFFIANFVQRIEQLLLAGVAISFMLGAITQFMLYIGEPLATNRVLFWLMGSLARVEMTQFYLIASVVIGAIIVILAYHQHIDALALGDENAISLGVNVNKLRLLMLALCAAITAVIVAYCGGIAFVGLMIPHIVRHYFGSSTLKLIIGSSFIGGCFLIWVDVIARSAVNNLELPIGIITSIIGSLFFLYIMLQGNRSHG
ncbi:MAG: iron ABC transporter permease [Alteromonadaceae bacterium]|nr:iron ABC transporter permease [Alteromonadaceae bacterium]